MKEIYSKIVLILIDALTTALSIAVGYRLRVLFDNSFTTTFGHSLPLYLDFSLVYIVTLVMLAYEGVYNKRYDFWHESRQIIKALILAFTLLLAFLAMTKSIDTYSRATFIFIFASMVLFIPLLKVVTKKFLYKIGLWSKPAYIYGDDSFISKEIFDNHYLGYVKSDVKQAKTIFINSKDTDARILHKLIGKEIQKADEVIFVPLINEYDLTQSTIYQLSSTRTNLIVYKDRLKSRYRIWIKVISDMIMSIVIFPLLIPIMFYIAYKIRQEEPGSSIFFKQERLGKNGEIFICYKFRTMYEESDNKLKRYLKEHPDEIEFYNIYHKYKSDPRITKIGDKLRRTSLDELPQIFNIFKREMSFIGPRPYMLNEKEKMNNDIATILTVKPGITGLWQVSGRSDVDFYSRVGLDVWYIRNWNLWMDLVILLKTIKTILVREGAY